MIETSDEGLSFKTSFQITLVLTKVLGRGDEKHWIPCLECKARVGLLMLDAGGATKKKKKRDCGT